MKSKHCLFVYIILIAALGYHCLSNFSSRQSTGDLLGVLLPLGELVAIVIITYVFSNTYPDLRRKDRLKLWLSFAPNVPILLVKYRPACTLVGTVVEINYQRFRRYPIQCQAFMLIWCNHMRAIDMAVNPQIDCMKDIVLLLRADRQAFHSYMRTNLKNKFLFARYWSKNQFNLGKYDPDRFTEMRKLINEEKNREKS